MNGKERTMLEAVLDLSYEQREEASRAFANLEQERELLARCMVAAIRSGHPAMTAFEMASRAVGLSTSWHQNKTNEIKKKFNLP